MISLNDSRKPEMPKVTWKKDSDKKSELKPDWLNFTKNKLQTLKKNLRN
jgi:hypothetical protein